MPRNGSGVASAVAGSNTVSAGTTILSALENSLVNDLITMFNTAWPVSLGGTGGTTPITAWDAIAVKGTTVPSASTLVLSTVTGPYIDISGTTSVTAVTLANNSWRIARATGIFVLTASASLLVNKSAAVNYTTAVGDMLIFTAEGGVVSVTVIGANLSAYLTTATAAATYLPLAGGTLTGDLTISKASPSVILNRPSTSTANNIRSLMNGLPRWWLVFGSNETESGSNAGSNLYLDRYDDAGNYIGGAIGINRATGTVSLPAGQLQFPATQNPSANANTIDDYEEGTFTPAMTFNGSATGIVYSVQAGSYVKVGQIVLFTSQVTLTNNGSGVGLAKFTGLPFTSSGIPAVFPIHLVAGGSGASGIYAIVDASATTASLFMPGTAAAVGATDTNCTNSFDVRVSGCYQASA